MMDIQATHPTHNQYINCGIRGKWCGYLKIVLIDPSQSGASGDKILSAFADLVPDPGELGEAVSEALGATGAFSGRVRFVEGDSHGIAGLRLKTELGSGTLDAQGMRDALEKGSEAIGLAEWGRKRVREALDLLISAEEEAHGQAHLHEVGEADTIVDILGTMKAVQTLGLDGAGFYTTPVAVGSGSVESMHGTLPVPAPATLLILSKSRLPITGTWLSGEMTTPTGAAILAALTRGRSEPPPMKAAEVGVGIGGRETGAPNITRVLISGGASWERIKVLETNVDDVDGEIVGWLIESLQGKVEDVTVLPMVTKKNRPGFVVRAVVREDQLETAADMIMKETGTLGVKVIDCHRIRAEWRMVTKTVLIGRKAHEIRFKVSDRNSRAKPEYEDMKRIASAEGLSLREVLEAALGQAMQK
jgi:uncharacterized protein (TIGR00299 family) protein